MVALARGESALCLRCGAVMVRRPRFGRDGTLAFTLTGLILAVPALLLPFITAGKFGQVRDVSTAALYLVSDDSAFINGTTLTIDGGLSAVHRLSVATPKLPE